jgi:hypothetical protein
VVLLWLLRSLVAAEGGAGMVAAFWWLLKVVLAWLLCVLVAAEGGAGMVAVRSGGC